jgi:hypothetical protein
MGACEVLEKNIQHYAFAGGQKSGLTRLYLPVSFALTDVFAATTQKGEEHWTKRRLISS